MSGLPEDGEVRLGSVMRPAGRRFCTVEDPAARPVVWVTESRVPDAGRLWWALSDLHAQTGLIPFLDVDDTLGPQRACGQFLGECGRLARRSRQCGPPEPFLTETAAGG